MEIAIVIGKFVFSLPRGFIPTLAPTIVPKIFENVYGCKSLGTEKTMISRRVIRVLFSKCLSAHKHDKLRARVRVCTFEILYIIL